MSITIANEYDRRVKKITFIETFNQCMRDQIEQTDQTATSYMSATILSTGELIKFDFQGHFDHEMDCFSKALDPLFWQILYTTLMHKVGPFQVNEFLNNELILTTNNIEIGNSNKELYTRISPDQNLTSAQFNTLADIACASKNSKIKYQFKNDENLYEADLGNECEQSVKKIKREYYAKHVVSQSKTLSPRDRIESIFVPLYNQAISNTITPMFQSMGDLSTEHRMLLTQLLNKPTDVELSLNDDKILNLPSVVLQPLFKELMKSSNSNIRASCATNPNAPLLPEFGQLLNDPDWVVNHNAAININAPFHPDFKLLHPASLAAHINGPFQFETYRQLFGDENTNIRGSVALNPNAVLLPEYNDLFTDKSDFVRENVASNPSAALNQQFAKLFTDPKPLVRSSAALNINAIHHDTYQKLFNDPEEWVASRACKRVSTYNEIHQTDDSFGCERFKRNTA